MCRDCGYTLKCKRCNISLTYHEYTNTLKCHYCGYEINNVTTCPSCKSKNIKFFGTGTEKLGNEIKKLFPQATTIRMDVDTVTKKNSHETILNKFKNDNIDILIGNKDKSKIDILLKDYIKTHKRYVKFYNDRKLDFEDMLISDYNHIRAFIKIEDGCDNFCSYCIIPYVRGSVRSKKFETVIKEAKLLTQKGHKEIVLTGIHTGHYMDNDYDLTDLINELSKIEDLLRIRISSIEITELNDKFLNMLSTNKKVCDHLHIPLQAGSDEILKRMNRKYDLKYYEEKIKKIFKKNKLRREK